MGFFDLASRIFNKKVAAHAESAQAHNVPRADRDIPLGAQVGGLLEIPRASIAVLDRSLLKMPESAQMQVAAISRIRMQADTGLPLFRLYTGVGADRKGQGESFLQILGAGEDLRDIAYYEFLCRVIPGSEEEQAAYLGKGYGLGEQDYWLAADMLQLAGLAEEAIATVLNGEDALHFTRDTPGGAYVAPFRARETRIDDGYGESGLTQRIWFMPYVRQLPDGNSERLLISFEAQESFDGERQSLVHVDFMVGVALDQQKVKVL